MLKELHQAGCLSTLHLWRNSWSNAVRIVWLMKTFRETGKRLNVANVRHLCTYIHVIKVLQKEKALLLYLTFIYVSCVKVPLLVEGEGGEVERNKLCSWSFMSKVCIAYRLYYIAWYTMKTCLPLKPIKSQLNFSKNLSSSGVILFWHDKEIMSQCCSVKAIMSG